MTLTHDRDPQHYTETFTLTIGHRDMLLAVADHPELPFATIAQKLRALAYLVEKIEAAETQVTAPDGTHENWKKIVEAYRQFHEARAMNRRAINSTDHRICEREI